MCSPKKKSQQKIRVYTKLSAVIGFLKSPQTNTQYFWTFSSLCHILSETDNAYSKYRKDTEPLFHFLCTHLYHTSFRYLSNKHASYLPRIQPCRLYLQYLLQPIDMIYKTTTLT